MFKNNDWFYISNYLKKSYKNLPSDYIDNLSNQSIYNINYHYDKIILGYDSGLEQVLDNIDFSYLSHDVIKIGLILNKGHLAYSNKSGIFKIYFIDYRDKICDDNLEYVCDTFTDLKLMNENVKKFLNFKQLQNNKLKNTSIEKISNKILSNHDFKIIKNMLKTNVLPQDFIDIFRFQSNFRLKIDDSLILTFGADSGKEICLI